MPKYKVVWDEYVGKHEIIVEAETESKATYKAYKSELGKNLSKHCQFIDFLKYLHHYTTKIIESEGE